MKKIFLLTLCLMAVFCKAEDIIITTDAQQLKVSITEVSEEVIKYKAIDNPDGPLFILSTNKINSIIFSNGEVKVYEHNTNQNIEGIDKIGFTYQPQQYITRSGNTYMYNGQYLSTGDLASSRSAYGNFLQQNCSVAYQQYEKGRKTAFAGWMLLSVGAGLDIGTLICTFIGYRSNVNVALGLVGGALELACIPTLIVGYHKMHDSADIFNQQCAPKKQSTVYWSINADANGIGLALNF